MENRLVYILMDGRVRTAKWCEDNGYTYRELTRDELRTYLDSIIKIHC